MTTPPAAASPTRVRALRLQAPLAPLGGRTAGRRPFAGRLDNRAISRYGILLAIAALVAAAAHLAFPFPHLSGDMSFALIWGGQLVQGDLSTFVPGPTPHPLAIGVGGLASLLGEDAGYRALQVLCAYAALGALVAAIVDVAWRLSGAWAALLATGLVLTSDAILMWTAQTGYDIAFAALVMWGVALELARPRRGLPVLVLLSAAGLLRPEGWVFAGMYGLWCAPVWSRRQIVAAAVLILVAPITWMTMDAAVTGDPLWSFKVTAEGSERLYQQFTVGENLWQGLKDLTSYLAVVALLVTLAGVGLLRGHRLRQTLPLSALLVTGLGIFVTLTLAGMASNPRYLLVPACLLAVAAAAVATAGRRAGRIRSGIAVGASALLLLQIVALGDTAAEVRAEVEPRAGWNQEIKRLVADDRVARAVARCPRVAVPGPTLVSWFAYFTDRAPGQWLTDPAGRSRPDLYVTPHSREVAKVFLTRWRFDADATFSVPPGMELVASTPAWNIYAARRSPCAAALI